MTADELAALGRAIEARFGLRVDDRPAAIDELGERRAAVRDEPIASYIARVANGDAAELRALARELTVGETYFFRHAEQFHAFADVALPARLAARGRIRVLSAGCASGEEAYTLAMIARDRVADPRTVAIHAVDVNPAALELAARGRYSRWSLRATPPELEHRWFRTDGRAVVVDESVRGAVAFAEANLATDGELWAPQRWDVIFCRNVLMYFTEARSQEVIARIVGSLAPGGYLFLGHAETLRGRADLELCHTHGTFYYRSVGGPDFVVTGGPMFAPPAPLDTAWVDDIHAATERVHAIVDGALAAIVPVAPRDELAEIQALYTQERFAEALDRIAALPAPLARETLLLRALVLTHAGQLAEAEAACTALLAVDPGAADAHYLRALCRDSAGDTTGAAEHARRAAALDPSFAMAHVQLGLLARRAGDRDAAVRALGRAIELLEREDAARLALFGGGFGRGALVALCRAELAGR